MNKEHRMMKLGAFGVHHSLSRRSEACRDTDRKRQYSIFDISYGSVR